MEKTNSLNRSSSIRSRISGWLEAGFAQSTFPWLLIVLFVLAFGLFLPQFGYFWDDWIQLLSHRLYGYLAYFRYFWERPFSGWTLVIFGPLMADDRVRWHIFTLVLRYATVLAAWEFFRLTWPHYRREAGLIALVFAVYPSFTQQPIAVDYSQQWLQYLLFLLSLIFMVLAMRRGLRSGGWPFLLAGLVCQVLQLSVTEFFIGIELIRPIFLWIILQQGVVREDKPVPSFWKRSWNVLLAWMPYLLVFLIFLTWRFAFQSSIGSRNSPVLIYLLLKQPLAGLQTLIQYALTDLNYILFSNWSRIWITPGVSIFSRSSLSSWAIAALAAVLVGIFLVYLRPRKYEKSLFRNSSALGWMGIGLIGIVFSQLPIWASGQDILDSFQVDAPHADRFTQVAMLWASLLLIGAISWLIRGWKVRAILVAVLVGILVGFQVRVGNIYRHLSQNQSNAYWQLAWRAPALQLGTAIIFEALPFQEQGMAATSSAINMLYPQPQNPAEVGYWAYTIQPTLYDGNPANGPIRLQTQHRIFKFEAQTPESIVVDYNANHGNCLWILRPEDADYPGISDQLRRWLPTSNMERIVQNQNISGYPSPKIFGPEPQHAWCYYFEKADLARQFGDWQTASSLADKALAEGFRPGEAGSEAVYEWLPFLEAYTRVGKWKEAADLVQQNVRYAPDYTTFLCSRWKGWVAGLPSTPEAQAADKLLQQQVCARK